MSFQQPQTMRTLLLAYYDEARRDLPWRRTRDPFAIWVSEIMLQQTQVATVLGRYSAFLDEFPTVRALAKAPETRVCEAWAGLGYYRRARNLHAAARQIVEHHDGAIPGCAAQLRALPGVGDYTSAAIASIAFGEPVPSVDGNVMRVMARLFTIDGEANSTPLVRRVRVHAAELVRCDRPGDVNQALMDLGATVCTPNRPVCPSCPLRAHCNAAAEGGNAPERYPAARKRAPVQLLPTAFAYVETCDGLLLRRRPLDGLWAGLWEMPSASGPNAKSVLAQALLAQFGMRLGKALAAVEHQLTHRLVRATIYEAKPSAAAAAAAHGAARGCSESAKEEGGEGELFTVRAFADPLSEPLSMLARKAILAAQAVARGR